jgi:hypothetical protein
VSIAAEPNEKCRYFPETKYICFDQCNLQPMFGMLLPVEFSSSLDFITMLLRFGDNATFSGCPLCKCCRVFVFKLACMDVLNLVEEGCCDSTIFMEISDLF